MSSAWPSRLKPTVSKRCVNTEHALVPGDVYLSVGTRVCTYWVAGKGNRLNLKPTVSRRYVELEANRFKEVRTEHLSTGDVCLSSGTEVYVLGGWHR